MSCYYYTEKTLEGWAVFAVVGYTVYRATEFHEKERQAIAEFEICRLFSLKDLTPDEIDYCHELEELDIYQEITYH